MTGLDPLIRALDAAAIDGRTVDLWWRDDDLEAPSEALDHLLAALAPHGIVPALAAVSARLSGEAVAALGDSGAVMFSHGWTHTNHAPPAEKSSEFGPHRPIEDRLTDCRDARMRLSAIAGDRAVPCFVPPWNRIGDDLADRLAETGLRALSGFVGFGRAPQPAAVPRLDTHVDLIDWRGTRRPISVEGAAAAVATWVERRLAEDHDTGVDAPIGILSHHRVTDRAAWASWKPLWALLAAHPAARWLPPRQALSVVGVSREDVTGTGVAAERDRGRYT
ncbi:MAG: polysaccharide deacetylase [Alphaproteobacteria bacterium]|nr:polysaccharide deacetylase [Alphaproteobacteria bacterium]